MIMGSLASNKEHVAGGYAVIAEALELLKQTVESGEPLDGRVTFKEDLFYVNFMAFESKTREEQVAEKHEQFIDIHYLIEGSEQIGWSPLREGVLPTQAYDEKSDYALYAPQPDEVVLAMQPGMFAVFFPDDIHRPGMGDGSPIKKAVVKIHKDLLLELA
ncbi:YhcH/YjgK/YiaL family protein [Paenibacillus sp. MCAF20]